KKEHSLTPSLSLSSNANTRERVGVVCKSSDGPVADSNYYPASSSLPSDNMREEDKQPTADSVPQQPFRHQDESLLPEVSTEGKGIET
ncbi:MAG: hypothetical protein J6I38_01510, partial [Prevotella sp.]|nr:hypothetical protein [Prevotella sp.]